MKYNLKSLLRSTKVLYLVFAVALMNFFTYLLHGQFNAIIAFIVIGIITRYLFSKNMIVILFAATVITNTLLGLSYLKGSVLEGMENKKKKDDKKKKEEKKEQFETRLSMANFDGDNEDMGEDEVDDIMEGKKTPKVDYASTLESAYDNLDKLLGSDAIRSMSDDTQRLAEKQKKLMGNIQKLEPMMNKAGKMLEGLDMGKMGDMLKGLEGKMGMFGSNVLPDEE